MPAETPLALLWRGIMGVPTLDVDAALLSMHSAREMCGSQDQAHMVKALAHFLCAEL